MRFPLHPVVSEATIASAAQKVSIGGAGVSVFGGLTATDWAAFGGLAVTVISGVVHLVFKVRADRRHAMADQRDAELHAARMAALARNGAAAEEAARWHAP